jgi:hypothetical protein
MTNRKDLWAGNEIDRLRYNASLSFREKLLWLEREKARKAHTLTASQIEAQYWRNRLWASLNSAVL